MVTVEKYKVHATLIDFGASFYKGLMATKLYASP